VTRFRPSPLRNDFRTPDRLFVFAFRLKRSIATIQRYPRLLFTLRLRVSSQSCYTSTSYPYSIVTATGTFPEYIMAVLSTLRLGYSVPEHSVNRFPDYIGDWFPENISSLFPKCIGDPYVHHLRRRSTVQVSSGRRAQYINRSGVHYQRCGLFPATNIFTALGNSHMSLRYVSSDLFSTMRLEVRLNVSI
jgi:hypothetical protein